MHSKKPRKSKKKKEKKKKKHINSQILNQKKGGEVIQLKMNPITRTESKQDKWINKERRKKEQYF